MRGKAPSTETLVIRSIHGYFNKANSRILGRITYNRGTMNRPLAAGFFAEGPLSRTLATRLLRWDPSKGGHDLYTKNYNLVIPTLLPDRFYNTMKTRLHKHPHTYV